MPVIVQDDSSSDMRLEDITDGNQYSGDLGLEKPTDADNAVRRAIIFISFVSWVPIHTINM